MNATQFAAQNPACKLKSWTQPTRGFKIVLQVPADVASFDLLAGKEGALLKHGTAEGVYRSTLPKVWKAFMEKAPKEFGVEVALDPSKDKTLKDGTVRKGYEEIDSYLANVKKYCTENGLLAELNTFVQSIADEVGYDLSTAERVKKPEPVFYELADQIIAKVASGQSDWDRVAANCAAKGAVSSFTVNDDNTADRDELAQVVKEAQTANVGLA